MDLSKYLPTPEIQTDFEQYKSMSPEEREKFQRERAKRYDNRTPEELVEFKQNTKQALNHIKEDLRDIKLQLELDDVANAISLSYVAKTYFGKSKAWLYQRLNGNKVNGKVAQFTDEERKRFVEALHDLSQRIEKTALKFT